jgi:hypothetical protein
MVPNKNHYIDFRIYFIIINLIEDINIDMFSYKLVKYRKV